MSGFSDSERLARLRLIRSEGVGPAGFRRLVQRFGSAEAALAAVPDLAGRPLVLADTGLVTAEVETVARLGAAHVFLGDAAYPPLLAELVDAPPVLVVKGDMGQAHRAVVAIVGARNASAAGRELARDLAFRLGEAGFAVASGLARGIDAAAHSGALMTGTIACIAGGIDVVYPPEHADLQAEVAARGLLLSEAPPGTEPMARHFPRRNRLIAGVAQGVVVVEAAPGSGSLITARLAGEAGREVMAVPGHPRDPRSRGGNGLIRDGAVLVETAADVLAVLAPFRVAEVPMAFVRPARAEPGIRADTPPDAPADALGDVEGAVLELLSVTPVGVDDVVRASGLAAADVGAILAGLEVEGRVVRLSGGRVALAAD